MIERRPSTRVGGARLRRLLQGLAVVLALAVSLPIWTSVLRIWVFGEEPWHAQGIERREENLARAREFCAGKMVHGISPETAERAFVAVLDHSREMEAMACYCGCGFGGHMNLKTCFIRRVDADKLAEYNRHGKFCVVCVGEVLQAQKRLAEGATAEQIQAELEQQFQRHSVASILRFTVEDIRRVYAGWLKILLG